METVHPNIEPAASFRRGWAVFAVLLAVLSVLFVRANKVTEMRVEGYPLVVADLSKLDFGERWEGETFTWTVPVVNRSQRAISVQKFDASCDCTEIHPQQLTLNPNESTHLQVRITASSKGSRPGSNLVGPVSLTGISSAGEPIFVVYLTGHIRRILELDSRRISISGQAIRGRSTDFEPILARPLQAIASIQILATPEVNGLVEKGKGFFRVKLRMVAARCGNWQETVQLLGLDENGKVVGRELIAVTACVSEPVIALPAYHHFGTLPVGELAEVTIVLNALEDSSNAALTVHRWDDESGKVRVTRFSDRQYSLRLQISKGSNQATVRFFVSLAGREPFPVDVVLGCLGRDRRE